ncbi:hypothetical protein CDOO_09055 [Corynebacterium doosanense CAU 212 = DSM 45436]|uniref:Uncharacterized protein n=1 Tax=Corynebacterium doosanense CAU 212 = DSM 45436 TaxID=558173 RepID=A0A097IJG5_9CORY|nr:hypothetical protein CDOO_09055 [Corynebacterium doosanense CAU 212 = DSM 45436]
MLSLRVVQQVFEQAVVQRDNPRLKQSLAMSTRGGKVEVVHPPDLAVIECLEPETVAAEQRESLGESERHRATWLQFSYPVGH